MSLATKITIQAGSALVAFHIKRSLSRLPYPQYLIVVPPTNNSNCGSSILQQNAIFKNFSSCSSPEKENDASTLGLDRDAVKSIGEDDAEMEEMWVDPDPGLNLDVKMKEHGGPRRGGRYLEPTRFGDWERKSRCSDF
jgi:hypothetical protein